MKIQKYTKTIILIILTLLLSYGLVSAWTNLASVNTGDSLTSTVWNNMATKLNDAGQRASGIFTDVNTNVGIGITSPSSKLHILSNGLNGDQLKIESGQNRIPSIRFNGPWSISNPSESYAMIRSLNDNGGPGNSSASLRFYTSSQDPAVLSEKMIITGVGNIGIGTSLPSQLLHVNGTALATAWNTTSDIRKKEDIKTIKNPLDKIEKLRGVTFKWKDSKREDTGVIAQEVEKEFPEFVTTDKDGYKSVDYGKLVSPLIESIKELKKENDKKDKQIDDLSKRLKKLENK